MFAVSVDETSNLQSDEDIQSDRVRLVFSNIPKSLLAVLVNSTILVSIQWGVTAPSTLLLWYALVNLFSLWRLQQYFTFQRLDHAQFSPSRWCNTLYIHSVLSGLFWGATAIWLFPAQDIAHQVFVALVLAGMSAGAVTTLSAVFPAALIFATLSLSPLLVQFILIDSDISHAMALMVALFTLMIVLTAHSLNQTITESFRIRHERNQAMKTIEYKALYDEVTRLPNRRYLLDQLKQDLARAIRHQHFGAVLFVDLDHFKAVNDTLGHAVGDELLRQVSARIRKRLREEDIVGRLGGDEFVILISEAGDDLSEASARAQEIAEDMLGLFAQKFVINGNDIHLTSSIGIAMYPWRGLSSDDFLQRADVAMYQSKKAGRNAIRQFIPEMQQAVERRREVEKGLRRALEKNELELYYQPIFNVQREIVCAEALLRWNHPEKGLLGPNEFIEIAEKTGLIVPLGDWVMQTAFRQSVQLVQRRNMSLSVNVSPRQFAEAQFCERVQHLLKAAGADSRRIRLEITESMMLKEIDQVIDKMHQLKSLGIGFSVDDFGTGYSSLSYLKQLPIDILKIDKSFVLNIDRDPDDAIIVETIIAMARHLKIGVVAEGVENEAALDFLTSRGCKNFQGYLFSKPVPFEKFVELLETKN